MKKNDRRILYTATLALCAGTSAIPAYAQSAPAQPAETSNGIEDIVVTAQRKAQSVLDVPLSITAVSGDQLADSGIRQVSDLQLTTPGFVPSNGSGYNQMFIRGIGNAIFVGADPSVATFIDDVPRVFGTMVNNFVDVERVEVIKGAPGALYGRNATGGAVNIITRQPSTTEFGGSARLTYGTKDTLQASAFVNVPLNDQIAWTVSGQRSSHDPYIKNITRTTNIYTPAMFPGGSAVGDAQATADLLNSGNKPKRGYNNEDFWAVSSKLLFRLSDSFKITFAGDYSKKDDDYGTGEYSLTPEYAVQLFSGTLNSLLGANTTPAAFASLATPVTRKFTTAQRADSHVKLEDYGLSATAVLSLDAVDITSISAWRKNKSSFFGENGVAPINFLASLVDVKKETFYQELRAVSASDGPLSYVAGASYLKAKFDGGLRVALLQPVPFLAFPAGSGEYTITNWSPYLQLGYDFTDRINLTVSGRYVNEKNDATSFNPKTGTNDPFTLKEEKFLPSATLKYSLEDGGNVYARWARGFKAGGIVPIVSAALFPDPYTQGGVFKGEEVDSYEIGIRSSLFDRKVQFTSAIFYNNYRNVQVGAHVNPTFPDAAFVSIAVVNAGSARTYGAEATISARVAEPLTLGASVGYLNAKYKKFRVANNPVIENFDLSGKRMINSPEWQLSANADLDQPINENWRAVGNVVVSYTDDVLWQQSGYVGVLPDTVGPSYWLVNARAGVRSADDRYELAVFARNLFNKAYTTFGNSSAGYGNILWWGDPRIIGVETRIKF